MIAESKIKSEMERVQLENGTERSWIMNWLADRLKMYIFREKRLRTEKNILKISQL